MIYVKGATMDSPLPAFPLGVASAVLTGEA